jgi:hypothetical protein
MFAAALQDLDEGAPVGQADDAFLVEELVRRPRDVAIEDDAAIGEAGAIESPRTITATVCSSAVGGPSTSSMRSVDASSGTMWTSAPAPT